MTEILRGVVRHWSEKGYGKIASGGCTYFVHRTELVDVTALAPGQRVQFTAVDTERGPRAVDVRPIDLDRSVSALLDSSDRRESS